MSSDRPINPEEAVDVKEHHQEQEPDFFSYFNLPTYEDGVNFGSSITSSIRRPMSAILAVVDTALAVLNEEFDSTEDHLMTSSSNHNDAHEQTINNKNGHANDGKVSGCCGRPRRSKTSKLETNRSEDASSYTSNVNNADSLSDSDDVLTQSSVVGSISKLELHEDFIAKEGKRHGIDSNASDNLRDIRGNAKNVDSSDYFMVETDRETKDGWLVVIDQ